MQGRLKMEKTELKERPIIMGAESVRAILEGRKTVTRRVVTGNALKMLTICTPEVVARDLSPWQVGDRLWVKESFTPIPQDVYPKKDGTNTWGIQYSDYSVRYGFVAPAGYNPMLYNYERMSSPLFMPRWASRINLEVVSRRIERLQDITEEDAILEGISGDFAYECNGWVPSYTDPDSGGSADYIAAYRTLWDSLNAKRGYPWESNPWVWVVSFKVVKV